MIMPAGTEPHRDTGLWPITKKISLKGPIPFMPFGLVVYDLPGLNDSNVARMAVTSEEIKHCDHGTSLPIE